MHLAVQYCSLDNELCVEPLHFLKSSEALISYQSNYEVGNSRKEFPRFLTASPLCGVIMVCEFKNSKFLKRQV